MQTMATELHQLQQDVTSQKAEILQMSSEKGELEQHLEVLCKIQCLFQPCWSDGDMLASSAGGGWGLAQ